MPGTADMDRKPAKIAGVQDEVDRLEGEVRGS
jgi:hypothetical protein